MTTLLVTGGLGFIGSNFIRRYLDKNPNHSVINIDNFGFAANPLNVKGIKFCETIDCDINDHKKVAEILSAFEPYSVVHFAAESHVDRSISSPIGFTISNVLGTHSLIEVCRNYWEFCKFENKHRNFTFVHVSTDEVYGSLNLGAEPFTEKSNYAPNSPYAASKAASDHIVRSYVHTYNFPGIITHCSNNYGPHQHSEKFIPTVIRSLLQGKKIPVYGSGKNVRDWIYVDDHNDAILKVLELGIPGDVYNIGAGKEINNLELASKISVLMGYLPYETIEMVADRPGHDFRYAIDNDKIRNELFWHPKVDFDRGLGMTINWYKGYYGALGLDVKNNEHSRNNSSSGQ